MKVKICEQCKTYNPVDEWSCNNCRAALSVDTITEIDDSNAAYVLNVNKTITNKILHVKLSGGLIGLFASNPRSALEKAIQQANYDGWRVIQVIADDTGNLIVWLLRILILSLTLLLWTPANGYYVVLEREKLEYKGGK